MELRENRGFIFTTQEGNQYFYDDYEGRVAPVNGPDNNKKFLSKRLITSAIDMKMAIADINRVVNHFLSTQGYRQLTLVTTQDCNLRCRYCVYSGQYDNMPIHRPVYMNLEVAKQALKKFFNGFLAVKRVNPYRVPAIGFYGGEPLMHVSLISNVVQFIKKHYSGRVSFAVTTNGTLLTKKVLELLYHNDFQISISLNGPKLEHDRLRIFPDGNGSFNIVWKNLQKIRTRYPEYYKTKCRILVCYDIGTDLKSMTYFFEKHKKYLPPIGRVSVIAPYFTNWYSQYKDKQKTAFREILMECEEQYFQYLRDKGKIPVFLDALFGPRYRHILLRKQGYSFRWFPYTGACIPGDKIAVDPEGNFHCCEKINDRFPIGDVRKGLEIDKISNLILKYSRQIFPECFKCPITRLCDVCYAVVGGNGVFQRDPPDLCLRLQNDMKERFRKLWSLFEAGVEESDILRKEKG